MNTFTFMNFLRVLTYSSRKLTAEETFYICKLFKCNLLPFDTKFAIFSVLFRIVLLFYYRLYVYVYSPLRFKNVV